MKTTSFFQRSNIYLRTYIANKFLSYLFSYVHKVKITDIATCLKIFKKEVIGEFNFEKNEFMAILKNYFNDNYS